MKNLTLFLVFSLIVSATAVHGHGPWSPWAGLSRDNAETQQDTSSKHAWK